MIKKIFMVVTCLTYGISSKDSLKEEIMSDLNNFYKNKYVLVTGGAGFIGSHIVDKLVKLEAKVTVLDNLSSGDIDNLKLSQDKINFINGDIRDYQTCLNACQNQEVIFHLAAMVSVPKAQENPLECHDINVTGLLNILDAGYKSGSKTVIFSSSSAVYGTSNSINKEISECNPESIYGLSKLIGEEYLKLYSKMGLQTLNLRYFNVYGERQKSDSPYSGVIAKFRKNISLGLPLIIYGDGMQTRDFVSVDHVSNCNILAPMLNKAKLNGQAVNIASGKAITILELISQVERETERTATVLFEPARAGDIKISVADCAKMKELFEKAIIY